MWGSVIRTVVEGYFSYVLTTFEFFKQVQLNILNLNSSYSPWIKLPIVLVLPAFFYFFLKKN